MGLAGAVASKSSTPPPLSVLVAEDHPVVREGLAALLARDGGFAVTGHATTGREVRAQVERQSPQVLVLDLMLQDEDGLALIKDLAAFAPTLRIVVFSLHPEEVYAERCLRAGAHGYVMKCEPVTTLFRAIREVAAGGIAVSPRVSASVLGAMAGHARQPAGSMGQLTDRELQVFRLVGFALPTRDIAAKLGVSVKTIETHRENLKNKLGLQSHAELVARAARWLHETEQG